METRTHPRPEISVEKKFKYGVFLLRTSLHISRFNYSLRDMKRVNVSCAVLYNSRPTNVDSFAGDGVAPIQTKTAN